jgi:hypothetical protein
LASGISPESIPTSDRHDDACGQNVLSGNQGLRG